MISAFLRTSTFQTHRVIFKTTVTREMFRTRQTFDYFCFCVRTHNFRVEFEHFTVSSGNVFFYNVYDCRRNIRTRNTTKTNVINNIKTMHRKVYVIFCLSNYGFVKTPTFAFIRCIVFGMLCKAKYSSTAFRCPAQW